MIAEVLTVYGREVAPTKKTARNIGYKIGHLLDWWGDKSVADISAKTCRDYAASKATQSAGADLKTLRSAVKYWHQEYGPLQFMPAFWTPRENPPRERWRNGTLGKHCLLAGTEWCEFDCPTKARWKSSPPEGEPSEVDGSAWDRLPPAPRAEVA